MADLHITLKSQVILPDDFVTFECNDGNFTIHMAALNLLVNSLGSGRKIDAIRVIRMIRNSDNSAIMSLKSAKDIIEWAYKRNNIL